MNRPSLNKRTSSLMNNLSTEDCFKHLQNIYKASLSALRADYLFGDKKMYDFTPKAVLLGTTTILVGGQYLPIQGKRCHIIGFGKAVLGMSELLLNNLGTYFSGGIISVPIGNIAQFKAVSKVDLQRLVVMESALDNVPDIGSLRAAKIIKEYVSNLNDKDVLFVLISGGGSSLLPMPRPPVTLQDKSRIVHAMHTKGATIIEINTVRIALSDIKGGRLAQAGQNCHKIVTLILSDMLGDPIDLIAGGPTCKPIPRNPNAIDLLKRYDLWDSLPDTVKHLLRTPPTELKLDPNRNVTIVVGNNKLAMQMAGIEAEKIGYEAYVASQQMRGNIEDVAQIYEKFATKIINYRTKNDMNDAKFKEECEFPFEKSMFADFMKKLHASKKSKKPLLLIFGGETTVTVRGRGRGGRNQELAMLMSLIFYKSPIFEKCVFLSVDTDGCDGLTSVSGAFGTASVISDFLKEDPDNTVELAEEILANNDSFHFYRNIRSGYYHISIGQTGTNVADLHFLMIP